MAEDLRRLPEIGPSRPGRGGCDRSAARRAPGGAPTRTRRSRTPLPDGTDDPRAARVVPKGLRRSTSTTPTSSWNSSPAPRPRRPARGPAVLEDADRGDRRRQDVPGRPDLRAVGLRQVVAGQGGPAAATGRHVLTVYVEATPEETEARLLRGLAQGLPDLPAGLSLVDVPGGAPAGTMDRSRARRSCIVLDQFEQWLLASGARPQSELVDALRQCDGEHVQAIVLVRDDFWLAASRFMRALEVRLVEGQNIAPGRPVRPAPRPAGPGGVRPGLRGLARARPRARAPSRRRSSTRRSPGWRRTARSSRSGWPSSPRWSRRSPGPRRP